MKTGTLTFGGSKRRLEECPNTPTKFKSAKLDSKTMSKDQKYEDTREQKLLDKQLADFPWLLYKEKKDLMFCRICLKYPKLSTSAKFFIVLDYMLFYKQKF